MNSDDLDNDLHSIDRTSDLTSCICPESIRPYKHPNSKWTLNKAIEFSFHKKLNESFTFNFWSYGLDLLLHTWRTNSEKLARQSLIQYTISLLFASTQLYFHYDILDFTSSVPTIPLNLHSIRSDEHKKLSVVFLLSDSHCKHFQSVINTTRYQLHLCAISGLQRHSAYNVNLSASDVIKSSTISTTLSTAHAAVLLLGINSIRCLSSWTIIEQVEYIINLIRITHPHLSAKNHIHIGLVFPCNKLSSKYPTIEVLHYNINHFNHLLKLLARRVNFSIMDLRISDNQLSSDQIHLNKEGRDELLQRIILYCDDLFTTTSLVPPNSYRSPEAIRRRNKKRHIKQLARRRQYTLVRIIHPSWKVQHVKQFLQTLEIRFARLPEVYHHKLRIQFNNAQSLQEAECRLSLTVFQEPCHLI